MLLINTLVILITDKPSSYGPSSLALKRALYPNISQHSYGRVRVRVHQVVDPSHSQACYRITVSRFGYYPCYTMAGHFLYPTAISKNTISGRGGGVNIATNYSYHLLVNAICKTSHMPCKPLDKNVVANYLRSEQKLGIKTSLNTVCLSLSVSVNWYEPCMLWYQNGGSNSEKVKWKRTDSQSLRVINIVFPFS